MEYYYRDDFEGETVFDQVMHRLLVQNPMALGVVSRANFTVGLLDAEHERVAGEGRGEFAVANLGCGPGREVELWAESKPDRGRVQVEPDRSGGRSPRASLSGRHQAVRAADRDAQMNLLHLSFAKLLSSPEAFNFQPQNYIFSSGLFDYLRQDRAQFLIKKYMTVSCQAACSLSGMRSGRIPTFGHRNSSGTGQSCMNLRDEMEGMAALLPDSAEFEVIVEPGEAYYFLLVRKE